MNTGHKLLILLAIFVVIILVLLAVARFTRKAKSDPIVQDMHENFRGTLEDQKKKQLLAEYWELVDRRISGGPRLSQAEEERLTDVYFELRKHYPHPQQFPRPQR